jgi:hypothetical protein
MTGICQEALGSLVFLTRVKPEEEIYLFALKMSLLYFLSTTCLLGRSVRHILCRPSAQVLSIDQTSEAWNNRWELCGLSCLPDTLETPIPF